jgi:hypothetical protein
LRPAARRPRAEPAPATAATHSPAAMRAHGATFGCWVVRLFSFSFREREISLDRWLGEA